jgi:hypothetical protein
MNVKNLKFFLLSVMMLVFSCKDDDLTLNSNYPSEIINVWIHSYEEDYGTYRPSNYSSFPESMFRQVYNFMEDNKCDYLVLSPVDAHYMENGFWEFKEQDNLIKIYDSNMNLSEELKVVLISSDKLIIE